MTGNSNISGVALLQSKLQVIHGKVRCVTRRYVTRGQKSSIFLRNLFDLNLIHFCFFSFLYLHSLIYDL